MDTVVVEFLTVGMTAAVFIFLAKILTLKYNIPIASKFFASV